MRSSLPLHPQPPSNKGIVKELFFFPYHLSKEEESDDAKAKMETLLVLNFRLWNYLLARTQQRRQSGRIVFLSLVKKKGREIVNH